MSKTLFTPGRVDIITMGCSKNLVDSERLLRQLESKGYEMHHDSTNVCGEVVIVNTCGFIGDAKEESIEMILTLGEARKEGRIGRLIVMGCLAQRYLEELKEEIAEVDEWYGKFDWVKIIDNLPDRSASKAELRPWERKLTTPEWSAYLKISEGCNRFCSFCAIPLITGRHKSRTIEEIVAEARKLASEGVKELNIIAQDLSSYGRDIYGDHRLAALVDQLADVEGIEWIRLHYAYPADFPWDLTEVMRRRPNVCAYLDIALQHISDPVLKNMRRKITKEETYELVGRLRKEVPGIRLRTTLMVGFPGETDKDFEELLQFVKDAEFDRMGAFKYCEEEDTWAQRNLNDNIPEDVKQYRLDRLMELQEEIACRRHQKLTGETLKVLIERKDGDFYIGRTEWDSPEVDPEVIVSVPEGRVLSPGTFVNARITSADAYELHADLV